MRQGGESPREIGESDYLSSAAGVHYSHQIPAQNRSGRFFLNANAPQRIDLIADTPCDPTSGKP
jgi:hypothetical protein